MKQIVHLPVKKSSTIVALSWPCKEDWITLARLKQGRTSEKPEGGKCMILNYSLLKYICSKSLKLPISCIKMYAHDNKVNLYFTVSNKRGEYKRGIKGVISELKPDKVASIYKLAVKSLGGRYHKEDFEWAADCVARDLKQLEVTSCGGVSLGKEPKEELKKLKDSIKMPKEHKYGSRPKTSNDVQKAQSEHASVKSKCPAFDTLMAQVILNYAATPHKKDVFVWRQSQKTVDREFEKKIFKKENRAKFIKLMKPATKKVAGKTTTDAAKVGETVTYNLLKRGLVDGEEARKCFKDPLKMYL